MYGWTVVVWLVVLALSVPYIQRRKHPRTRAFSAYLLFISVFTLASAVLYALLSWLAVSVGLAGDLSHPVGAAVFLVLIFVPAFLLARWQVKQPPRRMVTR